LAHQLTAHGLSAEDVGGHSHEGAEFCLEGWAELLQADEPNALVVRIDDEQPDTR
jgi:hypothetical protein